jgi:hypothetical protein
MENLIEILHGLLCVVWALGVFFKAHLFEVGLMKIAVTHESQNIPATYL